MMVNHICHPLQDRVLCEPDEVNRAAASVSVEPGQESCPDCTRAHQQQDALRVALGLTPERHEELRRRSLAALRAHDYPERVIPMALSPGEVLALVEQVEEKPEQGVLPRSHRRGHWQQGPERADG